MEARRQRRQQAEDFVFRTAYLHEAELVVGEFDRLGIAYYRAEEGPPGVRWAMPVAAAWAPGIVSS